MVIGQRIRIIGYKVQKADAPEYGQHQPSRDWCDAQLIEMGYILTEQE